MLGTLEIVLICVCVLLTIALLVIIVFHVRRRLDRESVDEEKGNLDKVYKLKTDVKSFGDENKTLLDENASLTAANKALSDKNKSLTDAKNALFDETKSPTNVNNTLSAESKTPTDANNALSDETTSLKTENKKLLDENNHLKRTNAELSNRVAAEMDIKISADESQFENISIASRPMKITEKYSFLFSNAWIDAKTAIDEQHQAREEEWKVTFLLDILTTSYNTAMIFFERKKTQIARLLTNPDTSLQVLAQEDIGVETKTTQLSKELMIRVTDTLKMNSMDVKLDNLEKEVVSKLSTSEDIVTLLRLNEVQEYLSECTNVTWNMVIQRPPMTLVCTKQGVPWQNGIDGLELVWNSKPNEPGATVKYVKKPQLYHGDRRMDKGEVYVDK